MFVMPKLFHDMVTSISKDACLRCEDLLHSIPEKIRHLSIVPWERRTVIGLHPVTKQVGNLDTFVVVNRSELQNSSMSSPFLKLEGLYDFLLKFKSLRTLDLSYTVIDQLPALIGNLKNLQYLAVNNTDIRRIPSELCLLENLQTLEARDCPQLVTLPEDIKNLAKLRHPDVRKQPGHVRMPIGAGQLMHLQSLPVLNLGKGLSDCSIQELRDLDNLHGDLAIAGLENITVGNDAKEAKLINKKYLETLTLEWSGSSIYFEGDDGDIAVDVFESLQPLHDLENLIVRSYPGSIFPGWIEKSPCDNLQSITLDNCYNCSMIPAIGDLLSLRYLCIRKMYALKTFRHTASLSEERRGGKFPALELLKLWEMYELDGWIVKDGDFPRLHTVSICRCPHLKSLPHFPSLVNLPFHHCNQLPEIQELLKLESLKIEGFHDIVSLYLPHGLPALKNLEISRCNHLVSVVGLSKLSSVERLKIVKCPKLDVVNKWDQYHFKKISTTREIPNQSSASHPPVAAGAVEHPTPSRPAAKLKPHHLHGSAHTRRREPWRHLPRASPPSVASPSPPRPPGAPPPPPPEGSPDSQPGVAAAAAHAPSPNQGTTRARPSSTPSSSGRPSRRRSRSGSSRWWARCSASSGSGRPSSRSRCRSSRRKYFKEPKKLRRELLQKSLMIRGQRL